MLGVHKKAMKVPVLAELGRFPISIKIICQILSFWVHIMEAKDNSHLQETYRQIYQQPIQGNSWLFYVQQILQSVGFIHVWENQCTFNVNKLKNAVSNILEGNCIALWKATKSRYSKLL